MCARSTRRPTRRLPTPRAPWQISDQGGQGMAFWRRDGKELYYLAADRAVMAVSVTTSPTIEFGKPRVLFSLSEATPIAPGRPASAAMASAS